MPTRYGKDTRDRAVRLVVEHVENYESEWAAITSVSSRLGMGAETLRKRVRQAEIDAGESPGLPSESAAELRALRRKRRELEQTVEVLKAATAFFVRESDPLRR